MLKNELAQQVSYGLAKEGEEKLVVEIFIPLKKDSLSIII